MSSGGYVTVESDDRAAEAVEQGLEFKNFLPNEAPSERGTANANRGYLSDQTQKRSSAFWNLDYYQQYFDVDTKIVLERCYYTLLPTSSARYVAERLTPQPDLYGPFWTLTTVIFALFVCSSLASSIVSYLSDEPIVYNFQLLSIAVSLVYAYGLGVPVALWAALRYLGVTEWNLVEALAVWGYGQFVWIPVSVLCIIPVPIVRWVLVGIAFGLSGYFLVANVYPIIATAEAKATRLLVIFIALLHAALAISFKVLFFSYYVVRQIGVQDPFGEQPAPDPTTTADSATMFRL